MQSDRKLAKLVNPSSRQFKSKPAASNLLIQTNNRSISHLILLSKTSQAPSFSQSTSQLIPISQKSSERPLKIGLPSPKQVQSPHFQDFFKKINRKTGEKQRLLSPNDLHFDISHHCDKPYFRSSATDLSKIDEFRKKTPNEPKREEIRPFSRASAGNETSEDYKQSLLREVPLALSEKNPPGGRFEQQLLRKWLDNQKIEIENRYNDIAQQISRKNIIYSLVFEELKRQLSCSCVETGELLRDLWEFQRKTREHDISELEKRQKKELRELKRDFEAVISSLEAKIRENKMVMEEKQEKIEDFILEMTTKEKTLMTLQNNEKQLNGKLSEMRKMLTFLKKKTDWLSKENENLLLKFEKKSPMLPDRLHKATSGGDSEIEDSSVEEEKIMLDLKENEGPVEHNINDLNQIIVSSIPEVKDIKKMVHESTEVTSEFKDRYQKDQQLQTEFTMMDKLFDKNLKTMHQLEEMCLDYQYKQQIKDLNSRKFRASVIAVDCLIEKITGRQSISSVKGLNLKLEEQKEDKKEEMNPSNSESEAFSQRNSMRELENSEEFIDFHGKSFDSEEQKEINEAEDKVEEDEGRNSEDKPKNEKDQGLLIRDGEEIVGNNGKLIENHDVLIEHEVKKDEYQNKSIESHESEGKIKIRNETIERYRTEGQIAETEGKTNINTRKTTKTKGKSNENEEKSHSKLNITGSIRPYDSKKGTLNHLENPSISKASIIMREPQFSEPYIPSITVINSPTIETPSIPKELIRVRAATRPSAANKSNELDFERVIELFKSENVKAQDFEEKYKRNLEILEVENAQRKKLENKNLELSKNIESLQLELERLRKNQENTKRLLSVEKRRKAGMLDKSQVRENQAISLEIFQRKENAKLKRKKLAEANKRDKKPEGKIPLLGQHVTIEYEHQKHNLGKMLLDKIKFKKMGKFHNFMHLKLVLKQIHMIYFERIAQAKENPAVKEQDFPSYVYTFFLSLFGLKKIADKRFIILILSVKKHLSFFRINIFARFLGLMDPQFLNYSIDELNKYQEALDFMSNTSTMGTTIANNESDPKFYVPYIRAVHYTGLFADTRMTIEENLELKKEIDTLKEIDPKNINKSGIIDFDAFMEKILNKYKILVNRAKTYVINAFAACDLDGNKMCNLQEFLLLNRHIESLNYDEEKLEKIFANNADIEKDREKNLSFDKFSVVCVEYNLFTDESQDRYLNITKKVHLEIKMEVVLAEWAAKKAEIEARFKGLTILSKEELDNWGQIIQVLDDRITGKIQAELKPTLIAHKMLDEESMRLVEEQKKFLEEGEFGDEDDDVLEELEEEIERFGEGEEGNEEHKEF